MTPTVGHGSLPKVIGVMSHRGGSGKTAVATGLASHLASVHLQRVMLVDVCPDGAAAHLMMGGDQPVKPVDPTEKTFLPLTAARDTQARVVWAPGMLRQGNFWSLVEKTARAQDMNYIVLDLPMASAGELSEILRMTWLCLLTVPCDGPAFRSLGPLLEGLNEERSRPNREFMVRAVMTMTGVPNPERMGLENYERRYLRPMLTKVDLPFDVELRRQMAAGNAPLQGIEGPGSALAALSVLAAEILEIAVPEELTTPVH
jgi:cellulose biosynthesis protein BcsQ